MRPWAQSATWMSAGGLYDRRRWRSFPCNRDVTLSDEARDKMIEEKVRESLRGKQTEAVPLKNNLTSNCSALFSVLQSGSLRNGRKR